MLCEQVMVYEGISWRLAPNQQMECLIIVEKSLFVMANLKLYGGPYTDLDISRLCTSQYREPNLGLAGT